MDDVNNGRLAGGVGIQIWEIKGKTLLDCTGSGRLWQHIM